MKQLQYKNITATQIMHKEVISLTPEMHLKDAWNILKKSNISGAPVVDSEGTLVGVISQSDLLRETLSSQEFNAEKHVFFHALPFIDSVASDEIDEITVEEAMHQGVVTVFEDDHVPKISSLMTEQHVHRVIVINNSKDRKVVGIISALDIVKLLAE